LHLDYTKVIILILWWRNFQLEYWRNFQLVSTHKSYTKLQIVCNKHPSGALHRLRYVLALRIRILLHRFGYSVVKNRKAVPVPPTERHETVSRGEPEEGHSPVGECVFSTGYLPSRISCNLSISGCSLEWFFCSAIMKKDAKLPVIYSQNRH